MSPVTCVAALRRCARCHATARARHLTEVTVTSMVLDEEDRTALLEVVRRFAVAEIGPLVARPEEPPAPGQVGQVLDGLEEVGVLTAGPEPGFGVWDDPLDPAGCRLSVEMLRTVAQVSPGVAFQVHVRALATWLDRSAGDLCERPHLAVDAGAVMSGRSTGRALAGAALSTDDQAVRMDAWGTPVKGTERLSFGPGDWSDLWWPEWTGSGSGPAAGWALRRSRRADLAVEELAHSHGLDEVTCVRWSARTEVPASAQDVRISEAPVMIDTFAAYALGLLSIATGAARRAISRARPFSETRYQGGETIGRHDAVAQLLARAEHGVWTAQAALDHLTGLPGGLDRLHQAWRARAQLHPLLTAAGSEALQVFGGMGYMRDTGVEKDQRDLNTLRRIGGSPSDLTLRCAALDDAAEGGLS